MFPFSSFSFSLLCSASYKSVDCPCLVPTRGLIVGIMVMIIAVTDFPIISGTKQLLKCTYCCDLISTQEQEMRVCVCVCVCVSVREREKQLNWCLGRACTALCTALFHVFALGFCALNCHVVYVHVVSATSLSREGREVIISGWEHSYLLSFSVMLWFITLQTTKML